MIKGHRNYQNVTQTLYCLDAMLSNNYVADKMWKQIDSKHIKILRHLIGTELNLNGDGNIDCDNRIHDDYVYDTFNCFIRNKHQIHIRVPAIATSDINEQMRDLIMHSLALDKKPYPRKSRDSADFTNLFKKELVQIFKYTKNIRFDLNVGPIISRISLWALLSIIKESKLDGLVLELGKQQHYNILRSIYPISTELKEKYLESNYEISELIQNSGRGNNRVYCKISSK